MWNRNNPYTYQDPSGYDALEIVTPSAAHGLGHLRIVVYDPHTGHGVEWSQGPVHESRISDQEKITKTPVADVRKYYAESRNRGDAIQHVTQTGAQDASENAFAQRMYDTQGSRHYNAFDNNCAEFVTNVLTAGHWATGMSMVPNLNVLTFKDFWTGATQLTPSEASTAGTSSGQSNH